MVDLKPFMNIKGLFQPLHLYLGSWQEEVDISKSVQSHVSWAAVFDEVPSEGGRLCLLTIKKKVVSGIRCLAGIRIELGEMIWRVNDLLVQLTGEKIKVFL